MRPWIGNDVIDLAEPGIAGKERDLRFMDRVFTPEEQQRIVDAVSPTLALWKTWAAKETAFKIASKFRQDVIFAHRRFQVGPEPLDATPAASDGGGEMALSGRLSRWVSVRFEDLHIRVRWETTLDCIHCVGRLLTADGAAEAEQAEEAGRPAATDRWSPVLARVLGEGQAIGGVLSGAERASVYSHASERVRLLARQLMARWDLQSAEIMRFRRAHGWGPPVLVDSGLPMHGYDISLSHDGRFVAAAIAHGGLPAPEPLLSLR